MFEEPRSIPRSLPISSRGSSDHRGASGCFVDWLLTRLCSGLHLGGCKSQGRGAGQQCWRKLRSADVTFPRSQPVLVSPIITHHFVYKWEIAFYCSVSSKRLKLIWNNPPAQAPIKAPGTPWCHTLWLLTRRYWYTNQSWLHWWHWVPWRRDLSTEKVFLSEDRADLKQHLTVTGLAKTVQRSKPEMLYPFF